MADKLHIKIITADKTLCDRDTGMVIAPGVVGEFGVLPGHMPFISVLDTGTLEIKSGPKSEAPEDAYAVHGGFLQVNEDEVLVLATAAEQKEKIDVERAKRAQARAEERLSGHKEKEFDKARAEAALKRAIVRLRIAETRPSEE